MAGTASVARLVATLSALAPIDGVSVPTLGSSANVRIDFNASATQPQKDAANAALASFDWSNAAQVAWQSAQNPDFAALLTAATQAVADNMTYLAIPSPTQLQAGAQVQALTRQVNNVIRYLAQL